MEIKCQYIVDENNLRIAVQIDISTFEKIEGLLENRALYELMEESLNDGESLSAEEAARFYSRLSS